MTTGTRLGRGLAPRQVSDLLIFGEAQPTDQTMGLPAGYIWPASFSPPQGGSHLSSEKFKLARTSGGKVEDADLLADLRRLANERGSNTVGMLEYREHGRYADTTISRRFGSWNGALAAAGLELSNESNLSDQRLFENLLALWTHLGRQPRRTDLSRPPSSVSQSPYLRRFGSWGAALTAFVDFANQEEASAPSEAPRAAARTGPRDPSLRLRFQVLQRDRFCCRACGASPAKAQDVELHVDHVMPWSAGGDTSLQNLRTLCATCNLGKGADLPS